MTALENKCDVLNESFFRITLNVLSTNQNFAAIDRIKT